MLSQLSYAPAHQSATRLLYHKQRKLSIGFLEIFQDFFRAFNSPLFFALRPSYYSTVPHFCQALFQKFPLFFRKFSCFFSVSPICASHLPRSQPHLRRIGYTGFLRSGWSRSCNPPTTPCDSSPARSRKSRRSLLKNTEPIADKIGEVLKGKSKKE